MTSRALEILTIGHSTLSYPDFVRALKTQAVSAVADVRSAPYSRYTPHYNLDQLRAALKSDEISYVFLGKELGGRPIERTLYHNGVANYEQMATTESFKRGLERVIEGARKFRVALMCSEKEPLDCHRCLLVGRALAEQGINVQHIEDGTVLSHSQIEDRLLKSVKQDPHDFFSTKEEILAEAYRKRATKVAFRENSDSINQ